MTTTEDVKRHLRKLMAGKGTKPKPLKQGYVYFCGPEGGPVKIGWSTDPDERIYRLQTGIAAHLHIWAEVPGTKADETAYHNRFADAWMGGEWFARTPSLEAEIASLSRLNKEQAA